MPQLEPRSLLDPRSLLSGTVGLLERFGDEAYFAALCIRSGLAGPELPHKVAQMVLALERYGMLGGAMSVASIRHGDELAVIDELGELTYRELDDRVNAIARGWIDDGLEAGDGVAILARNHRGFLEAFFAAAKCGARIILLNTSFSARQIKEVAEREEADMLVYDDEYSNLLEDIEPKHGRWLSWTVDDSKDSEDSLQALAESGLGGDAPPKPSAGPRIVILTSGTTGTPKGAGRDVPLSLAPVGGLLSRVPFRARERVELCAPIFHAHGFSQMLLAVGMGSTLILHRKFDPEGVIESLQENKANTMVAVPVMLQRMLGLDDVDWDSCDFSELKIIFVSGSALGAGLAEKTLDRFGPVLYNLYGSTEIAYATIANPEDLETDPSTAGKVVRGAVVKILDEDGKELPKGETGRIFVGNSIQFEGYTGGGDKERVAGLMSSGDVGHFDENDRLFIDGRDDEMIVSGGENVFPREVEELLEDHDDIEEAAAIGVDDEDFGQRLKAFVVLKDGADLDEKAVKEYVKENLARYKVPREVVFLDELPRNQTGKVLKRELEQDDDEDSEDGGDAKSKGGDDAGSDADARSEGSESSGDGDDDTGSEDGDDDAGSEDDGADAGSEDDDGSEDDGADAGSEDDDGGKGSGADEDGE